MVTTAGIIAPMMTTLGLDGPNARALAVIAIGAGAMVVSHANDSYFWVVTQFSGMTPRQGYRLQTLGTLVEGAAAAGMVFVLSRLDLRSDIQVLRSPFNTMLTFLLSQNSKHP